MLQEIAFINLSTIQAAKSMKAFFEAVRLHYQGDFMNTFMRSYAQAEKNSIKFEENMDETSKLHTRLGSICEQLRISLMKRK